jgi:hypothetical protein
MNPNAMLTRETEEAIQDCLECHRVCVRTFGHLLALEPDAELATPEQLNLLVDCADICRMAADYMMRFSEFNVRAADLCCEICRRCQQLCELPSGEDPVVLECVSACARCANSCKRVHATATAP